VFTPYLYNYTCFTSPNSSTVIYPVTLVPIHVTAQLSLSGVPKLKDYFPFLQAHLSLHDFDKRFTAPHLTDVDHRLFTIPHCSSSRSHSSNHPVLYLKALLFAHSTLCCPFKTPQSVPPTSGPVHLLPCMPKISGL
jgi:hypothetical protein